MQTCTFFLGVLFSISLTYFYVRRTPALLHLYAAVTHRSRPAQREKPDTWWWRPVVEQPAWGVWKVPFSDRIVRISGQTWEQAASGNIAAIKEGTVASDDGLVFNNTKAWTFHKWYWERHKDRKDEAAYQNLTMESEDYLSLLALYNDFFQHVVFDTFPKLVMACPFLHKHENILVLVMTNLQRDLVRQLCDIDEARFRVRKNRPPLKASAIYIPYFEGVTGNDNIKMGLSCKRCIPSLGPQHIRGTKIIYLPRLPGSSRYVENEKYVLAAFRAVWPDLEVYQLQNNWKKDRLVMAKASVVISPHGGGLANIAWAPVNTSVIELSPIVQLKAKGSNERPCYLGLAQALGFDYFPIQPQKFEFDGGAMVVPVDRVREVALQVQAHLKAKGYS